MEPIKEAIDKNPINVAPKHIIIETVEMRNYQAFEAKVSMKICASYAVVK